MNVTITDSSFEIGIHTLHLEAMSFFQEIHRDPRDPWDPPFQASMEAQSFQAATALAQSEREEDAAQFSQELNFVDVNDLCSR